MDTGRKRMRSPFLFCPLLTVIIVETRFFMKIAFFLKFEFPFMGTGHRVDHVTTDGPLHSLNRSNQNRPLRRQLINLNNRFCENKEKILLRRAK